MMNSHLRKHRPLAIGFLAITLIALAILFIQFNPIGSGWDFRNNLWAPAYQLVHHQSPYDIQPLFENSNAVWMPVILGLFFPLGYLPLETASSLWSLLNVAVLIFIVFLSMENSHRNPLVLAAFSLAGILFLPTLSVFILGQVSLLICLTLMIITIHHRRLHPAIIGLLFALSLTKPQLSIFFIPVYLIIQWKEQGFKKTVVYALWLVFGIIVLTIPLFIFFPDWIPDFVRNLQSNRDWLQPNLYALVFSRIGTLGPILGVAFFLIGLGICVALTRLSNKMAALMWIMALTPFFSPYIWSWDFVLFIPPMIYFFMKGSTRGKIIQSVITILCIVVMIGIKLSLNPDDHVFWWVPALLVFSLLANILISCKNNTPVTIS